VSPPGQAETEALIRAALGGQDVAISHIKLQEIFQAQMAVAAAACRKLSLDEAAIDQMRYSNSSNYELQRSSGASVLVIL